MSRYKCANFWTIVTRVRNANPHWACLCGCGLLFPQRFQRWKLHRVTQAVALNQTHSPSQFYTRELGAGGADRNAVHDQTAHSVSAQKVACSHAVFWCLWAETAHTNDQMRVIYREASWATTTQDAAKAMAYNDNEGQTPCMSPYWVLIRSDTKR